jgi:hypothetical protein
MIWSDLRGAMNLRLHRADRSVTIKRQEFWENLQGRRATASRLDEAVAFETALIDEHAEAYLAEFRKLLTELEGPVSGEFYRLFWRDVLGPALTDDIRVARRKMSQFAPNVSWPDAALQSKRYQWEIEINGISKTEDVRAGARKRLRKRVPASMGRGRPPRIADDNVIKMGNLYLNLVDGRVYLPISQLREIALELDEAGISPKEEKSGLSEPTRKAIRRFNSACGNSKARRIRTFVDLVEIGKIKVRVQDPQVEGGSTVTEVDLIKAFRQTLRACAKVVGKMAPPENVMEQ